MIITTEEIQYKTLFSHAQIEITGACNMNCKHCRASNEVPIFMTPEEIGFLLDFADFNRGERFNLTISGGEPFLHPGFLDIMDLVHKHGFCEIVVTTNGSIINHDVLSALNQMFDGNLTLQISLDSVHEEIHDSNRRFQGAYQSAIEAFELISQYHNLTSSARMTITSKTINEIESMVELLFKLHVSRLGVGGVIPAGRGAEGNLALKPQEKHHMINKLAFLARQMEGKMEIVTEDPLKCLVNDNPWISSRYYEMESNPALFGGCTAGVDCFNANTRYQITPCSVFNESIIPDFRQYDDVVQMTEAYCSSELVKGLCKREFEGECEFCRHKRICGGCRAAAKFYGGNYFSSDGSCWIAKGGE